MNQPPPLPPAITPEFQRERTSAVSAAKFGLWAPVLTVPVNVLTSVALTSAQAWGTYLGSVVQTGVTGLVIVTGFAMGWFALLKVRRVGREQIFGRAVAGIVINGMLMVGFGFVGVRIFQRLAQQ
jgi:hypothetical protein